MQADNHRLAPSQMFQSSPQAMKRSTDPKIKKPVKQQLNQQGDTQPAKNFPLQQSVQNKPKQSNVWSRLGPEKKDADEEWTPDKADGGDEQQNEYVDEGVCEGPNFIQELGKS